MIQKMKTTVHGLNFCPYEDVLGVGHGDGFTSLIIPGKRERERDHRERETETVTVTDQRERPLRERPEKERERGDLLYNSNL